jgi:hypothetical protein
VRVALGSRARSLHWDLGRNRAFGCAYQTFVEAAYSLGLLVLL